MNLIYLHGFNSSVLSVKGQLLLQASRSRPNLQVHLPDLNQPPRQVIAQLSELIESLDQVVLVGSSVGGFYATYLQEKYALPAVLINPAVYPWQLFHQLLAEQLPYQVSEHWVLDQQQLDDLQQLFVPVLHQAQQLLVLLQQGDEVLDYRQAQRYYSQAGHQALIFSECAGNHAMTNFAEKIPMLLTFLAQSLVSGSCH